MVKTLPANAEDLGDVGLIPELEKHPELEEKEMATHFHILAWKSPWTEEPGGWAIVLGVAKSWA